MKKAIQILALTGLLAAAESKAILLTDMPGVVTSAGSCYGGCGNAAYDHSNIIDHDLGGTGNTGLNSWNSGFWGGYVQIDFLDAYTMDRVELYGASSYFDPFTLSGSVDGTTWFNIASGGYHVEPALSQTATYGNIKYGAVFDVGLGTLGADVDARYLRYTVNQGSPEWGYLFELRAEGHVPVGEDVVAAVPEPKTLGMFGLALASLVFGFRRHRARRG